jgi:hypothetical protein
MKAAYWIFLAGLAAQISSIHSSLIKGIEFTPKNLDGVNLLFDSEVNYSQGFTTCLRVMFTLLNAYKVFDSQNIVNLGFDDYSSGNIVVRILGNNHHCQWPSQTLDFQPFVWYVFCLSYDAETNLASFTIDGQTIFNESSMASNKDMIGNSTLFSAGFPFTGMVTDFNVWNRSLVDEEIKKFVFCKNDLHSNLTFSWANANLSQIVKNIQMVSIPTEDICTHPSPPKVEWIKTPMNYDSAVLVGQYLNGEMSLPSNSISLKYLFTSTNLSLFCNSTFWVPIKRARENSSVWVNGYNESEEVKYLPWAKGQPNGNKMQACVRAQLIDYGYNDANCNSERCFNVIIAKSPTFHLRGPCVSGDNFDSKYFYNFDAQKLNQYMFQGFSGKSMIIRNGNVWNLKVYNATLNEFVLTASVLKMGKFPFGTQNWTFNIECENRYLRNSEIKLTKVRHLLIRLFGSLYPFLHSLTVIGCLVYTIYCFFQYFYLLIKYLNNQFATYHLISY